MKGLECPIILCENDPATVAAAMAASGNERIYFAVPDVITSNSAPEALLREDPLSVVTEDGVLFVDAAAGPLPGTYTPLAAKDLLQTQWTAKLFLHNTPHCVAAYLGALAGVGHVHEAMAIPRIDEIVAGAMTEMLNSLKLRWEIPHPFLEWYADKELARFRNNLLCDPIARVAREPLRKLEADGRLIGAAQICLASGFIPHNLLAGIASALLFANESDADRHLGFMRSALSPGTFISPHPGAPPRRGPRAHSPGTAAADPAAPREAGRRKAGAHRGRRAMNVHLEAEALAALKAVASAEELLAGPLNKVVVGTKESRRDIVTNLDLLIERHITAILEETGHPVLGEERFAELGTIPSLGSPVWLVDPIDGTVNFFSGMPYYAISTGFWDGNGFKVGAVSLPAFKELFFTHGSESSHLNGKQLRAKPGLLEEALIGASFPGQPGPDSSWHYQTFGRVNEAARGCLRLGSAASLICLVACGRLQGAYGFNAKLWDVAGGLAVAAGAGCEVWTELRPDSPELDYVVASPGVGAGLRSLIGKPPSREGGQP
ncbi:MAG: hypothetical protein IPL96_14700 [Holophagaceae bacterium]|nr:hypothetical protein [Holophagaceae bacterium]